MHRVIFGAIAAMLISCTVQSAEAGLLNLRLMRGVSQKAVQKDAAQKTTVQKDAAQKDATQKDACQKSPCQKDACQKGAGCSACVHPTPGREYQCYPEVARYAIGYHDLFAL